MSFWTAIVIIVIAAIVGDVLGKRYKSRETAASAERLDALEEKLEALDADLRERVQVLERIVTDRKEDLKRQFDYLDKAS
jgi:Tfp pilus assembly protein PilN